MTLPDNRIRLPPTRIDFDAEVGVTGQAHDTYPAPETQPRFDHMRMFLVGLLANQAAYVEPTQYRNGTVWFDLNLQILKIRTDAGWVSVASVLGLEGTTIADVVTLADWYAGLAEHLSTFQPEITFSGNCTADGITQISIPASLRSVLDVNTRCFLWVNGIMLSPSTTPLIGGAAPTAIRLHDVELENGDTFIALLKNIREPYFYTASVTVP